MSISSTKIYWAKVFHKKKLYAITSLALSEDGKLLIAHSGVRMSNSFIVILESSTGKIVSARVYTSNSFNLINLSIK